MGNPSLSPTVYEMVLGYFLNSREEGDHRRFLTLVLEWPHHLYNLKNVITALNKKIKEQSDDALMDALAKLYFPIFFLFLRNFLDMSMTASLKRLWKFTCVYIEEMPFN